MLLGTNSLVYDVKTDNFYEDITSDIKTRFEKSCYRHSQVCPLLMEVNKKVIGLMKDELGGRIMTKFVALRQKLYAYKMLSESGDKKCKGVKKCIMKKTLDFEDYRQCVRMCLGISFCFGTSYTKSIPLR